MNCSILKNLSKFYIQNFLYIGNICSRNYSKSYNVLPLMQNMLNPQERQKYKSHVSYIIEYLTTVEKELPYQCSQHIRNVLNFNLPGHVQDSGPLVVSTYKHFAHPEKQTSENIALVYTMGWSVDMIIRCFQIVDDILDLSETRANKPCWYKIENIGLNAINDSVIIGEVASVLIKGHLHGHPSYIPILELTHNTRLNIALGQVLDLNFNDRHFNIERWKTAAKYKGTWPAVVDPIVRGMYMAEVFDKSIHSEVKSFLKELGEYFTAQNDMMDCYGDPTTTGKHGNDIIIGRCTWLAVQALVDANTFQRGLFQKHYGKPKQDSQKLILDLYNELNIFEKFLSYEEKCYKRLNGMIGKLSTTIPKEFMYNVVDAFFGKL